MSEPIHLVCDDALRKRLAMITPSARWESAIDKPGGKGPTGRRRFKDDDDSLVSLITARTGEQFFSRSHKLADGAWTVRLLTVDESREIGRVDGLELDKGLHRRAIQLLMNLEYKRRADEKRSGE
jgi:hypothetical protein